MTKSPIMDHIRSVIPDRLLAVILRMDSVKGIEDISNHSIHFVNPDTLDSLLTTIEIISFLEDAGESKESILAWFMGMQPELGDASPAEVIRIGFSREVLSAAESYVYE